MAHFQPVLASLTVGLILVPAAVLSAATTAAFDFQSDIQPILTKNCFAFHGPDDHSRQANFRIDQRQHATGETGGHAGIVPGNALESRVYLRITHPDNPMPPAGERLKPQEIELIKAWIEQGAPYQRHWAFVKPDRPELPQVSNRDWPKNEIDYFVLARLEKEDLEPSSEADKYALIRRLSLDLIGLPPSRDQVEAFTREPAPTVAGSAEDEAGSEANPDEETAEAQPLTYERSSTIY